MTAQLEKKEDPGLQELKDGVKEALDKVHLWSTKSGEVVAAHQVCPSADLEDLPYDQASLKTCVKAVSSLIRQAKDELRPAKADAESAAAPKAAPKKTSRGYASGRRRRSRAETSGPVTRLAHGDA